MALKDLVEDYTGTVTDTAALDQWLTEGARAVISVVPAAALDTVTIIDPGDEANFDPTNTRVLSVLVDGREARQVSYAALKLATDGNSIYAANKLSPVYAVTPVLVNGQGVALRDVAVAPTPVAPRQIIHVPFPTLTNADSAMSGVPPELGPAVILYAAIRVISKQASDAWALLATSGVDLSTQFTQLATLLDGDQDIELAETKLHEIAARVDQWRSEQTIDIQAAVEKARALTLRVGELRVLYQESLMKFIPMPRETKQA